MTLLCVNVSGNKKIGPCATTYRAGSGNPFGTCPNSCELMPDTASGSGEIDRAYEDQLRKSKPKNGKAFTYTHFPPEQWSEPNSEKKTVFNYSAKTLEDAVRHTKNGTASVTVVPDTFWNNSNVAKVNGVRFVRCLQEYNKTVTCQNCGKGSPLCARSNRDYVVTFTAHGASKKKASDSDIKGGCYGNGGRVRLHWNRISNEFGQKETDADKLKAWFKGINHNAIVRYHVVGDLGRDS